MDKYNLHVSHDTLKRVKECVAAYIDNRTFLPVEVLSDLVGSDLSCLFGAGDLGWRPCTLQHDFRVNDDPIVPYLSIPKPEEIPARTVREQMEDLARRERPTLKDSLIKNNIHNGADPCESVCMKDALAILRRWAEAGNQGYMPAEVVNQLSEMRTLIHTLIGAGENCCDETTYEHAEAVRKATHLDAMDALSYAIRAMIDNKGMPGVKTALNSIYGIAAYNGARIDDALERAEKSYVKTIAGALNGNSEDNTADNVSDEESPALFVTIETGTFEVTPENIQAVNSFVLSAGEGRDVHFRII